MNRATRPIVAILAAGAINAALVATLLPGGPPGRVNRDVPAPIVLRPLPDPPPPAGTYVTPTDASATDDPATADHLPAPDAPLPLPDESIAVPAIRFSSDLSVPATWRFPAHRRAAHTGQSGGVNGVAAGAGSQGVAQAVDQAPRKLASPVPRYPESLRRRGLEGEVIVRVLVATDGRLKQVEILDHKGADDFCSVVVEALQAWRYSPARYRGEAVEVWISMAFEFRLTN
ncbi:MAG: energy transducer TonB [Planctomycetota bacterium]